MKHAKIVYCLIALFVFGASVVAAIDNPFNEGWQKQVSPLRYERWLKACDYNLSATPFRQVIVYEGAGVRNYRGECIIPSRHRQVEPVAVPEPVFVAAAVKVTTPAAALAAITISTV